MADGDTFELFDQDGNQITCNVCTYTHDPTDLAQITGVTATPNADGTLTVDLTGTGLSTVTLALLKNDDEALLEGTIDATAEDSVSLTFDASPAGDWQLYV